MACGREKNLPELCQPFHLQIFKTLYSLRKEVTQESRSQDFVLLMTSQHTLLTCNHVYYPGSAYDRNEPITSMDEYVMENTLFHTITSQTLKTLINS